MVDFQERSDIDLQTVTFNLLDIVAERISLTSTHPIPTEADEEIPIEDKENQRPIQRSLSHSSLISKTSIPPSVIKL